MAELRFTRRAEDDLTEIAIYTEGTWGFLQADRYIQRLHSLLDLVARSPCMGRGVRRRAKNRFGDTIRRIEVGRHVILYKTTKSGILILRILHEKMNFLEQDFDET